MLLISNAESIGLLLGDTSEHRHAAIVLAVIGFWVLDLSNNTVQGPCRALLVDVAPPEQQNLGGSLFSFMLGMGNLIGYFLGSQHLTKVLPFLKTDLRALFTLGMITLVSCILTTVLTIKEKPLRKDEVTSVENPFVLIFRGLTRMPPAMVRVCLVQFFTWVGWFTVFLYITTWVGEVVYNGDPDAPAGSKEKENFDAGVRWGSLGLCLESVVTMAVSLIVPLAVRVFGVKVVYSFGQALFAVCLFAPLWIKSKIGSLLIIAALGIPWSIVMILPFTLVALSVKENESGTYMGVLNIFVVLPQIVVSLGVGELLRLFHGRLAIAFAAGGVSAVISAALCWLLIIKNRGVEFIAINGGGGH